MASETPPIVGFQSHMQLLENMLLIGHLPAVPQQLLPASDAGRRLALQAMQAYGLTDTHGHTTRAYANLVEADDTTRTQMLRAAALNLYPNVVSMVEGGATEDDLVQYFMRAAGLGRLNAEKAVNHYNGASMVLALPRNEHLRVLRGYKPDGKGRKPKTTQEDVRETVERVLGPAASEATGSSADNSAEQPVRHPAPAPLAANAQEAGTSLASRYLEALLRSVENQVENGQVPPEELLSRIDNLIGVGQSQTSRPPSQGGSG